MVGDGIADNRIVNGPNLDHIVVPADPDATHTMNGPGDFHIFV